CQTDAAGNDPASELDIHCKKFLVIRTGFTDRDVAYAAQRTRVNQFLQRRFKINGPFTFQTDLVQLRFHEFRNQLPRRVEAAIQINSTNDGFQCVDQQRLLGSASRLFLASSKKKILTELQLLRIFHQVRRADEKTFELGEFAFG